MIIPIRCFTCGKEISSKWEPYVDLLGQGRTECEALDILGLGRKCCRRMLLCHEDIIEKVLNYDVFQNLSQNSNVFAMLSKNQIFELKEAFGLLDTNNDGIISKEDLKTFLSSIGDPFTESEIDEMMEEAGSEMSFMMFLTLVGEKLSCTDEESVILQAFKDFDENRNGFVEEKVLKKWLTQEGDKMCEEDVDFLLKDCCENGMVDYKKLTEIIKHGEVLKKEEILGLIYMCSVEIIPYVMTWDGIVTKYHKSHLKRLEIPMNVEAYIQSIVLKKTVETISFDRRRGLESGLNAEESCERASMGVIMRAEMHEEPIPP
ncbi:RNA polymerase N, partial [Hamiltosporidium magnivora]